MLIKKIVINNGNIITYKMLYIPVGMLLTVYLETFAMKRWIALAIPFSTATLPIFAPLWSSSKLLYFQRVGRTTESNNWFNCIVVSLRYCCLTIFLTIPGVRKARDGLLRCNGGNHTLNISFCLGVYWWIYWWILLKYL